MSETDKENNIEENCDDNVICIGRKDDHVYIIKGLNYFANGKTKELIIKSRGMLIPRTIFIADQIARNVSGINHRVNIGTEILKSGERVSYIEIHLNKFPYIS